MKNLNVLLVLFLVLLWSCKGKEGDRMLEFMPGTYVNYALGEYSVAWDTLVVEPLSVSEHSFRVYRNTGFRRIKDGQPGVLERRREHWLAEYDVGSGTLVESRRVKLIRFYPDSDLLVVGSREYRKLDR